MKNIIFFLIIYLLCAGKLFSQNTTIKGYIFDNLSKKPIEFAEVGFVGKDIKVNTDKNGFFSLSVMRLASTDSLFVFALGYETVEILVNNLKNDTTFFLIKEEEISGVTVTSKRRLIKEKIGNFVNPRGFFLKNIHHYTKLSSTATTYIPNKKQKDGFIERVHIHINQMRSAFMIDPITKEKIQQKDPEYIKIRIRCFNSSKELTPMADITNDNMIFEIRNYKSQWIDISKFNIPFDINGAFVGMEILEVKQVENWGWGSVNIPIFKKANGYAPDYYVYSNTSSTGKKYQELKIGNFKRVNGSIAYDVDDNSLNGSFNFGAEVSFILK